MMLRLGSRRAPALATLLRYRCGGGTAVQPQPPLPPPREGGLEERPENELYLPGDPNYVYKGQVERGEAFFHQSPSHVPLAPQLDEEAELRDPYSMTPDEETHFDPAMGLRHLGLMLGCLGVFGGLVWTLKPTKPTVDRNLNWELVDKDMGNHTNFAGNKESRGFRAAL